MFNKNLTMPSGRRELTDKDSRSLFVSGFYYLQQISSFRRGRRLNYLLARWYLNTAPVPFAPPQILVPEWGAEVSKKSKDNLETIKKTREQRRNGDNDVDND